MHTFVDTVPSIAPLSTGQLKMMRELLDFTTNRMSEAAHQIQITLGVSEQCALDVAYLRTRPDHTSELEQRLLQEHASGKVVNIIDWPQGSTND